MSWDWNLVFAGFKREKDKTTAGLRDLIFTHAVSYNSTSIVVNIYKTIWTQYLYMFIITFHGCCRCGTNTHPPGTQRCSQKPPEECEISLYCDSLMRRENPERDDSNARTHTPARETSPHMGLFWTSQEHTKRNICIFCLVCLLIFSLWSFWSSWPALKCCLMIMMLVTMGTCEHMCCVVTLTRRNLCWNY